MAENQTKTTSSKAITERNAHILRPHNGAVRKLEHELNSTMKHGFNEEGQTLPLEKNKLKRKKKLSVSLTSVGDAVNQEKRTRIEGIHLNINSRSRDASGGELTTKSTTNKASVGQPSKVERPVLIGGINVLTAAPQRFKRKMQENLDTIQKLNALAEQLRLEVNELKSSLITERGAVRALRAQNDADSRKWRNEMKKLQQALESTKKSNGTKKPNEVATSEASSHLPTDGMINYEMRRLTNEIAILKEANKAQEEQTQIIGQADRRKAADMRQLKSAFENRLTQIQKSAKIEITRLLEEIKTKDRNLRQMKKDLQSLQHNGKRQTEAKPTKPKTNESSQKLKKPKTTSSNAVAIKAKNEADIKDYIQSDPQHTAQVTPEITQLKNIELMNNTKNAHKSKPEMRTTKAINQQQYKQQMNHEKNMTEGDRATTMWMEKLLTSGIATTKPTMEYRTKDHNSDTDSALSSAPPSISPQPPSSGADSGLMWQALQDMDKLQKEVEIYHKENERLQAEMQLIKQELLTAEKVALSANENQTHISKLMHRIKELEDEQVKVNAENNELREQNELLEFRILELEDDKMDGTCQDHCERLANLLRRNAHCLDDKDKHCLQQLLLCVQQLDLDAIVEPDNWQATTKTEPRARHSRIIATVQPYSNSAAPSAPTTPSKQLQRAGGSSNNTWLNSSSLSESGVFVECDLSTTIPAITAATTEPDPHPNLHLHLQYYQERLVQLEGKLLVYESSGETQAKHLAERLQRELQLRKQVKELIERVELLVEQNALLDEAKCEFEEAENDTRLNLQRTEEELEILRERNIELEFSKDALSAKYRDCRAECLILREDLNAAETQLDHLRTERQRINQQLEKLQRSLPLLLIFQLFQLARINFASINMGNEESLPQRTQAGGCKPPCCSDKSMLMCGGNKKNNSIAGRASDDPDAAREINYLKEEVKTLRCSLKELNARHYEAMESADSHWVDLEREYKMREEAYRTKETCLKQKINKLQDCLRDDSRAAAEKIQQLEESEHGLKACLVRLTKEHRDLMELNRCMENEAASQRQAAEKLQPIIEELKNEKRRNQTLADDLCFAKKLLQSMEEQLKAETDCLRKQIYDLKKELMNSEVTNCELKEEVSTLEAKIAQLKKQLKACAEHACCLEDELRTKDELVQKLEKKLGVCPEGFSLADELYDNPEKRAKREQIRDLETASQGLGCALRDLERRERELPTHKDFQTIACSVKQLADTILHAQKPPVSDGCECNVVKETRPSKCQEFAFKSICESLSENSAAVEAGQDVEVKQEKVTNSARGSVRDSAAEDSDKKGADGGAVAESEPPTEEAQAADEDGSEPRTSGGGTLCRTAGGGLSGRDHLNLAHIGRKLKQQISEVPTKLRRLVYGRLMPEMSQASAEKKSSPCLAMEMKNLRRKRRQCKRFMSRSLYRGRVRRSGATGRPIDLHSTYSESSFHSAASVQTAHSEQLMATVSTQYVEVIESRWDRAYFNSIAQTEPVSCRNQLVQAVAQMSDVDMQTECNSRNCAVQAENVGVEARLQLLPGRTRAFLLLLEECIKNKKDDSAVAKFRTRVLQLWEGSEEFRERIELMQDLCTEQANARSSDDIQESYDIFGAALGCVHALKFALRPNHSPMLQQLEDRINERLIRFHNCPALMYTLHERSDTVHSCHQDSQTDQSYVREASQKQSLGVDVTETQSQTQGQMQVQSQMHTEAQESPRDLLEMEEGSIELTKISQTDTSYVYDNYLRSQGKEPLVQDKPSQTCVPEQDLDFATQQTRAKRNLHDLDKIHYPTQYTWRTSNNLNRQQLKDDLIFECECGPNSSINDDWRRQFMVESRTQQQQTDLCCSSKSQPSIPSATAIASTEDRNKPEVSCKAIRSKSLPRITCVREKSLPRAQQETDKMYGNSNLYSVDNSQNNTQYVSCAAPSCGSEDLNRNLTTYPISNNLSNLECPCTQIDNCQTATAFTSVESSQCSNPDCCSANSAVPNATNDVECQCSQMDRTTTSFQTAGTGTIRTFPTSCECDTLISQTATNSGNQPTNSHFSNVLSDVECDCQQIDNNIESATNRTHSMSCECGSIYYTAKFSASHGAHSTEQIQLYVCPNPECPNAKSCLMPSNMNNETEKYLSPSSDHTKSTLSSARSGPGDNRRDENSYCPKCCCIGTGTNMTTAPDIESGRYFDADRSHITTSINSQPVNAGTSTINWESEISNIATRDFKNAENSDQGKSEMNPLDWQSAPSEIAGMERAEEKQPEKSQQEEKAERIESAERAEMGLEPPDETVSKDAKTEYFEPDKSNITTSINNTLLEHFTETQNTGLKCLSELCQQAARKQQSRRYYDADCSHITTSCCRKSSMGYTDKTSSRSQSVMAKVTCLCSSAEKMKLGQARHQDLQGPPFSRIRDPVVPSCSGTRSAQMVFMHDSDVFHDCHSSSDTSIGGSTNRNKTMAVCTKKSSYGVPSTTKPKSESVYQESDREMSSKKPCNRMLKQQSLRSGYKTLPSESQFSKSHITTSRRGGDEPNMSTQFESVGVVMSCRNPSCIGKQHFEGQSNQEIDRYAEIASEGTKQICTCGDHDGAAHRSLENQALCSTQMHRNVAQQNDAASCCLQSDGDLIYRSTPSESNLDTFRSCISEFGYDAALVMTYPSEQYCQTCRRQEHDDADYSECTSEKKVASYRSCTSEKCNSVCMSKERIVEILNMLGTSNEVNVDRTVIIQELFRELNTMLRQMEEDENNQELPISYEDCIAAVAAGRKPAKAEAKSNEKLARMECLDEMEKCMEKCFPAKKNPFLQPKEIVAFERDPHFDPFRNTFDIDAESKNASSKNFVSCTTDGADSKTLSLNSKPSNSTDNKYLDFTSGDSKLLERKSAETLPTDFKSPLSISSGYITVESKSKSGSVSEQYARNSKIGSTSIPSPEDENIKKSTSHSENSEPTRLEGDEILLDSEPKFEQPTCLCSEDSSVCTKPEAQKDETTRDSEVKSSENDEQKDDATNQQEDGETGDKNVSAKKCLCVSANLTGLTTPPCPGEDATEIDEVALEKVKQEECESAKDSTLCSTQLTPDSGAIQKRECDVSCDPDWDDNMSPLTERERLLCEYMIRRMCELCGEEQGIEEATTDGTNRPGEPCICCHCRALICDNQCKTMTKTLDAVRYDPVAETKFFIDSIICDLQAMNHVMKKNNLTPKNPKPSPCLGQGPGESFPVTITAVSSLGCRALYVRWALDDCTGVGGYEIYVDGHLTNRFYSARHESGVVANVDVTKRHQIVLRAQAVGYEFPGDEFQGNGMIPKHPELLVGATRPWTPSVYVYEP